MSYPILYSATETNFDHNGIGILSACVSCEATEEANGIFELAMQYPMDGIHYAEIADRAIIKAKADQFRNPQLFRVYAISRPMNGIVTVLAEHISYDLSGIPVKPFSAESAASAFLGIKNNAVVDCPFDFWTDKGTAAKFTVSTPASIRSRLGGAAGSILDVYGGEYEFDNFTVKLHNNRGLNRGVSIRYGKNLTDIQQDQNCSNVATGIYPYWAGMVEEKDVLVELPEKIVNAPGTYNFVKIRTLDLSGEFETQPTVEQLRSKAETYIQNNNIGVPVVSWSVSFEQLTKSEEYKHLALLERVSLFDTVNVEFPALGVSATAKAVKIVYDGLADRVKSVTLGSVRSNIADTIANQQTEIDKTKEKPSLSMVQKISSALAKAIIGANGGSVRLIDTNEDGDPDELYIADDPDPMKAVKVWRFNYNGWAASKNGYSGPFEFGATLEDGLLAKFVTAANLVAGTIESQDNGKTFYLNLDTGELNMNATALSVSGKTIDAIAQEKADAAEDNAVGQAIDIAQSAVNAQTQADIFNKLTNNGALQGLFMQNGQLYINASYITALEKLFAKDITMTGKFECTAQAYLPPTYDDIMNILWSISYPDQYPPKDSYDLDGDGSFTNNDFVLAKNVYLGKQKLSSCAGAIKTTATVTIDMSNPDKTIRISGTNAFGSFVECYVGINPYDCSFASRDYLDRMIAHDPGTKGTDVVGSKVTVNGAIIGSTESWEATLSNAGSHTHTCARTPVAVIVGAQYQGTGLVTGIWTPATSGLENSMYGETGGYTDVWPTTVTINGKNVTVKRGGNASLKYFVTAIMQMD